jgi:hypothetical protein
MAHRNCPRYDDYFSQVFGGVLRRNDKDGMIRSAWRMDAWDEQRRSGEAVLNLESLKSETSAWLGEVHCTSIS